MEEKKHNHNLTQTGISRRRFIAAASAASAGLVWSACSKKSPTDPTTPDGPEAPESATVAVGEVKMYDHNVLKSKMTDMLDKLGGLGDLIKSGDTVGLKINLTAAMHPREDGNATPASTPLTAIGRTRRL